MDVTTAPVAMTLDPLTEQILGKQAKGVAMVPPPPSILPAINDSIAKALEQGLRPGEDMAAVGVMDGKGGWNTAIVVKVPDSVKIVGGFEVVGWVGKEWDETAIDYGAVVRKGWSFGGKR